MGLLDTDGEITTSNSIGYSTTSKRLAEDVVWLVRSLGGKDKNAANYKAGMVLRWAEKERMPGMLSTYYQCAV